MSITETSTKFESEIRKKKLIIYNCFQCPHMVSYIDFGYYFGYYCKRLNPPDKNKNKIQNPKEIPDFCELKDEI